MIKGIIFDFGGVILRTQNHAGRHAWDEKLGVPKNTLEETFFNSEMGKASQQGAHTEQEQWEWTAKHFGISAETIPQLKEDFWSGDVVDQKLIQYIRALQKKYHTAIISNAMDGLRPFLIELDIIDAFETIVISAEIGTTKPAPKIYNHCLELMGLPAEETVFIDDFMHNIAGGHAVGMHGIHYPPRKGTDDLIAELSAMGVEI